MRKMILIDAICWTSAGITLTFVGWNVAAGLVTLFGVAYMSHAVITYGKLTKGDR
jgi:hypothetical protein